MGETACRFCRSRDGAVVLDLGRQPASELFPALDGPAEDATFPLRLWLCSSCGLAQLADDLDVPEDVQGAEPAALVEQRVAAVGSLVADGILPQTGTVAEFPSPHGGTWLGLLAEQGLSRASDDEAADVVVDCCFGLMHESDQRAALAVRAARLRPGGVLVLAFHSLAAVIEGAQWNAVRHGHFGYYSTPAMRGMLEAVGLTTVGAWRFALYGGTVVLAATADGLPARAVEDLSRRELAVGVTDAAVLSRLQDSVSITTEGLREFVRAERAAGRTVYGYAAASRAVALLCLAGLDSRLLSGVADASPAKRGTRMPGTDIPVIGTAELIAARPDVVLMFVSDVMDEARAALPQIEAAGGRWVDVGHGLAARTSGASA